MSAHALEQMQERNIPQVLIPAILLEPHSTREGREGRWKAERHFTPDQWPVYTRSTRGYTVMVVYVLEDAAEELRKRPVDFGGQPTEEEQARWESYVSSLEGELTLTVVTVIKTTKRGGSR